MEKVALHTAYALLGIQSAATPAEVRRAFRRQLVAWHRARATAMVEHIRDLRHAYALIQARGSEALPPRSVPEAAALPPQAAPPPGWSPSVGTSKPSESGESSRYRTEGRLRTQAATEFSSCAARQGAEAVAANEAMVDAIFREDGQTAQSSKRVGRSLSDWLSLQGK